MVERKRPLAAAVANGLHLRHSFGFKGCSADLLLDFLHSVEMDCLFLVGDIIDVWSMQKSMLLAAIAQQRLALLFWAKPNAAPK